MEDVVSVYSMWDYDAYAEEEDEEGEVE